MPVIWHGGIGIARLTRSQLQSDPHYRRWQREFPSQACDPVRIESPKSGDWSWQPPPGSPCPGSGIGIGGILLIVLVVYLLLGRGRFWFSPCSRCLQEITRIPA